MSKIEELKNVMTYHKENGDEATLNYYKQQANQALQQANNSLNAKYSNPTELASNQYNYQTQISNYNAANTAVEQLKQVINQYKQNQVQLNNANEIAQKYTGSQLKAQGMANVGESVNTYNAVNNQYLNNVASNNQQYSAGAKSIADKYASTVAENNLKVAENNFNIKNSNFEDEIKNEFIDEMYLTQDVDDLDYIWNERGYAGEDAELEKEYNKIRINLLASKSLANLETATNSKQVDDILSSLGNMDGLLPSAKKRINEAATNKKAILAGWDGQSETIDLEYANESSFGTYKGTNKNGSQDSYTRHLLSYLKKQDNDGKYKNDGVFINMNYGHGKEDYYFFQNGKFYKVSSLPSNVNVINSENYYSKLRK